eukprot:m.35257 g.35257  ORF g.35257 m.35257 type:complete len:2485 (+) comp9868_c0_seq1:133-7587(+)
MEHNHRVHFVSLVLTLVLGFAFAASPTMMQPSFLSIVSPTTSTHWTLGQTYNVTYTFSNVDKIYVDLYRSTNYTTEKVRSLLPYPYTTMATGSLSYTVPSILARSERYQIVISDVGGRLPAPSYSEFFSISTEQEGPCPAGFSNPTTGQYPCTPCDVGTYWVNGSICADCPSGNTTLDRASKSIAACNVVLVDPLSRFQRYAGRYLFKSNAAGENLEAFDHKTLAECAQICLADKGCKSFDAGNPIYFQAGDCFLSYDNKDTIKPGDFGQTYQLDYYEKTSLSEAPLLDFAYEKSPGCYIDGSDEGGVFKNDLDDSGNSQEACAQLCMNDVNCKSFDAGIVSSTNPKIDYCFLSYETKEDATPRGEFKCDESFGMDFFQKKAEYIGDDNRCEPGFASQTGFGPDCELCPVDTYSTRSRTICALCPRGTISPSGSDSVKDCVVPSDLLQESANGAFRYGSEWVGTYVTTISDGGVPRNATGGLELQVVSVTGATVTLLGAFQHGEYCKAGVWDCRTEGISKFYLTGTVVNGVSLKATAGGWIGITDRTFNRENLQGTVNIVGSNTVFSGVYGQGTFSVTERCFASQEIGAVDPGDKFIGRYVCDRQQVGERQPLEGEQDIRRMDVFIEKADVDGNVVAVVDFDHADGPGEYRVSGVYDADSQTLRLSPSRNSWMSPHPVDVIARVLNGRLSEDGEYLTGQVMESANCACTGEVPSTNLNASTGSSCAMWSEYGRSFPWCYVPSSCADGNEEQGIASGYHWAACEVQTCSTFELTRVCADPADNCDQDWTPYGSRCYRLFSETKSFDDALTACTDQGATLVSIHNLAENAFVNNLETAAESWIGLLQEDDGAGGLTPFEWHDGAQFTFSDWARNQPTNSTCAYQQAADARWASASCFDKKAYVCEKLPIGRNYTCECSGLADVSGFGSSCRVWDTEEPAWCYVTENCPRAFQATDDGLWKAYCYEGYYSTTTNGPTTLVSTTVPDTLPSCNDTQYFAGTGCVDCLTADDCMMNQTLVGECRNYSGPVCASCYATCATCDGTTGLDCTTCAFGFFWDAARARCVSECPAGQFLNKKKGQCQYCSPLCATCTNAQIDSCLSCDIGGALFLSGSTCSQTCPSGHYKDTSTHTCRACTQCDGTTQYQTAECGDASNTVCGDLTECLDSREFQLVAPTQTSDRVCRSIRECKTGQFVAADPTPTSDRLCANCMAGSTDHDFNWRSQCVQCGAGTYAPEGSKGPCISLRCTPGSADFDEDPTTPCNNCTLKASYQPSYGETECINVTVCQAGEYPYITPSTTSNIRCAPCVKGTFKIEPSNEECTPATVCQPGTYMTAGFTVTSDTMCKDCEAGTFSTAQGATSCAKWATCLPGEYTVTEPTSSSQRECDACPIGTFSVGNGTDCMPWTECNLTTTYEAVKPTAFRDRQCANATMCKSNEFVSSPLQTGYDRDCSPLTRCSSDKFESTAPSYDDTLAMYVSDRECTNCTTCANSSFVESVCSLTADTVCKNCVECSASQYESQPCDGIKPRTCLPCSTSCKEYQFMKSPCTATYNMVCVNTTVCSQDEYESVAVTATTDRICQPLTQCQAGDFVAVQSTNTSDRICENCTVGYFSTTSNSVDCQKAKTCQPGSYEVTKPTASNDRECQSCGSGQFSSTLNAEACTAFTTECEPGMLLVKNGTNTTDNVCVSCGASEYVSTTACGSGTSPCCAPWTACSAGYEEDARPTTSSDRTCKACPSGMFNEAGSMTDCRPYTPCGPGYEAQPFDSTADKNCTMCPTGYVKAWSDIAPDTPSSELPESCRTVSECNTCQPLQVCAAGYVATGGSATSDVECTICPTGTFKAAEGNDQPCVSTTTCGVGQQEDRMPTASSDRECELCPQDFFKSAPGNSKCMPATQCEPGTFVLRELPALRDFDRSCAPCNTGNETDFFSNTINALQCSPTKVCAPGFQSEVAPTPTSDRVCVSCPALTFKGTAGSEKCQPAAQCVAGYQESVAPTATTDRTCIPCNIGIDTVSSWSPPGATQCFNISDCAPGTFITAAPTVSSDRTCQACGQGKYQDGSNMASCKPLTSCNAGDYEVTAPTSSSDRVCGSCNPDGVVTSFSAAGATECTPIRSCDVGEITKVAPTVSTDRICTGCPAATFNAVAGSDICLPVSICVAGEYEATAPSTSADRVCAACNSDPANPTKFSLPESKVCQDVRICEAGEQTKLPPTVSTDRICTGCATGTFNPVAGGTCQNITRCVGGEREDAAPSTSTDRVCVACNAPGNLTMFAPPDSTMCYNISVCDVGEFALSPATNSSDVKCIKCPQDFFQPLPGQTECNPVTVCQIGEQEGRPPTTSTDRVCEVVPSTPAASQASVAVVGGAVGGVALLIILIIVVVILVARRKKGVAAIERDTQVRSAFSNPLYEQPMGAEPDSAETAYADVGGDYTPYDDVDGGDMNDVDGAYDNVMMGGEPAYDNLGGMFDGDEPAELEDQSGYLDVTAGDEVDA